MQATNDPAFGATAATPHRGDRQPRARDRLDARRGCRPTRKSVLAGATPYLRLFANAAGGCLLANEALAAHPSRRQRRRRKHRPHRARAILRREYRGPERRARSHRHRRRGLGHHRTTARRGGLNDTHRHGHRRRRRPHRADERARQEERADVAAMYDALAAAIAGTKTSPHIRSVLIAGVPGAFCAGNDMEEFRQGRRIRRRPERIPSSAFSMRSPPASGRSSPRSMALRSASAPPCCCIATMWSPRARRASSRRSCSLGLVPEAASTPARAAPDGAAPRLRHAGDGRAAGRRKPLGGRARQCRLRTARDVETRGARSRAEDRQRCRRKPCSPRAG